MILTSTAKAFTAGLKRVDLSQARILSDQVVDEVRYLVLAEAVGVHRLCLLGDTALDQPLIALTPMAQDAGLRLEATQRLQRRLSGRSAGPAPRGWGLTGQQRDRLNLMLQAIDAWRSGKSHRQIAVELLDPDCGALPASAWKLSPVRARTLRLVADGMKLMQGGYLRLLRGATV